MGIDGAHSSFNLIIKQEKCCTYSLKILQNTVMFYTNQEEKNRMWYFIQIKWSDAREDLYPNLTSSISNITLKICPSHQSCQSELSFDPALFKLLGQWPSTQSGYGTANLLATRPISFLSWPPTPTSVCWLWLRPGSAQRTLQHPLP